MSDAGTGDGGRFTGPSGPAAGTGPLAGGAVRSLSCSHCGAAIELRGLGWSQTVACPACASVLDARDPNLAVLQAFDYKSPVKPLIPLGTRGQWRGALYEVIGFQVRRITVDQLPYSWREYLLFNPYHGFRYLTEYEGHWNDVVTVFGLPQPTTHALKPAVVFGGRTYRHFQTAKASTVYVLGEFPWEVRVNDAVEAKDYIAPPHMLSSEEDANEVTWSEGEYVQPVEIWRAFKLSGSPPRPKGVFANQPAPGAGTRSGIWRMCFALLLAILAIGLVRKATASNREIALGSYVFNPKQPNPAFVTPSFDLAGGRANVVVKVSTSLSNSWVYLNYALVEENTGAVFDFGREVGSYYGYDSDGPWHEGSRDDDAKVGRVPAGRYFLRVEPEGPPGAPAVRLDLRIRRDVPSFRYFFFAMIAVLLPPLVMSLKSGSFEAKRWAESDPAPSSSGSDDD
jgi:hypothetical protein